MYSVFADQAKKFGVEAAVAKFSTDIHPDRVEEFRRQYEEDRAKVQAGGPPIITAGRDDWYSGPGDDSRFWNSLRTYMLGAGWSDDRLQPVHNASDTVVAHTPRPSTPAWDAKGLVVGYVQSGKTTNFTAVIAKLADEDYRLVIVLSGLHNGLRRQTQERLDQQLKDLNKGKWFTLTEADHDFRTPTQHPSAILGSDRIALAVVKKNTAVLRKLAKWLERPDGKRALQSARVLIIDDEADQASVATTSINPLIRRLMKIMPMCTYIGYTATPFANVFIDPASDDLYPKTFILNLPLPDGYFGPEVLFGRDIVEGDDPGKAPDGYDMIRIVPDADLPKLRPSRNEVATFRPVMTEELADSVRWFWLATAARYARGDRDHSTMLVHTVVNTSVHRAYRPLLEEFQRATQIGLAGDDVEVWDHLRNLWEKESPRVPAADWGREQNTWDEIAAHLVEVVLATRVVLDNSKSKERLDYSGEPVVAIAVGANTLSRGLTLNGLVSSFFVRSANAYDTLLQMGRWFGFRLGYEDLPRIWMTTQLRRNFRHLATVEYEMRDDIDRYQRENLTPEQLAVRIRTHPSLQITAKMGAAQSAYVSYAGRRLQTRYFRVRDAEWLAGNFDAAADLVQNAARQGTRDQAGADGAVQLFRDVPVGSVRNFLESYEVHEESTDLKRDLLLKYIDRQLDADPPSLETWTVAIVGGDREPVELGGISVGTLVRSRLNAKNDEQADIKTLMSKEDRVLDLGITASQARAASEARLAALRKEDPNYRNRGLLVLYPIEARSVPVRPDPAKPHPDRIPLDAVETVIGMGIVFPGQPSGKNRIRATHMSVNLDDVVEESIDEILNTDTEEEDE